MAAAAVERTLELVPLVRDGRVDSVQRQVLVDLGGLLKIFNSTFKTVF